MILRLWLGWTEPSLASAYDEVLTQDVAPRIMERGVEGLRSLEVWTRRPDESRSEAEFLTAMRFDDLEAVRRFTKGDHRTSVVPDQARRVLARFDAHSAHYDLRRAFEQ